MGVIPPGTKLAAKPDAIQDWDKLSAEEKRLFARQAEVFAAFLEMTDYEVGRMMTAIDGVGTIYVDGKQVAQGRVEQTQPTMFSADETADVGIDLGTPVVEAIGAEAKLRFTGKIPKVTIEVREATAAADEAAKDGQKEIAKKTE
jgi:hypothetical protein